MGPHIYKQKKIHLIVDFHVSAGKLSGAIQLYNLVFKFVFHFNKLCDIGQGRVLVEGFLADAFQD